MRWQISLVLLFCMSVRAAYVVNNAGRKIQGSEITATSEGGVTLKTKGGQVMTFQRGQYRTAVADRPRSLDLAENLIREGRGGEAVPYLKLAKKRCRFLRWDQRAMQLLADHYFETGQYALAVAEFQALDDQSVPENRLRLREAMLKSGDLETAAAVLNEDIRTGSREAAAQAYLMRGKLKRDRGDIEGARRDWMKVALFFKTEQEAAEEAMALWMENEE